MNPTAPRLFFLDWVRIIAFFVLIVYHVGMYYVSWDWHVKSPFASTSIEPLMMLSSPWRLSLLFLVSGVASSFMVARLGAGRFMRQRSVRLLLPLVFGMFVIVPPQAYFEVVEKVAYQGGYADFMKLYVTSYRGFCRGDDCLDMPTWNHLWFVAYLWAYTLAFGGLMLALGSRFDALARRVTAALQGWRLIVLPVLVLALIRLALRARFETTHALVDDWYNHANYFFLFVLGAMMARERAVWPRLDALRWQALGLAVMSWAALVIFYALPDSAVTGQALVYWRLVMSAVYVLCAWCAMVAACGFAHRHLNVDGPARRYLVNAVFPVYIVHQTLIVSMAHLIKPAGIAPAIEGPMLIALTLCISFGIVEVVRRCALLRPVFGLPFRMEVVAARQNRVDPGFAGSGDGRVPARAI